VTLLGTLAFISNGFLPSPIDKMFIMIQALSFALGSLLLTKGGAVYASLINGILLSLFRTGFFPFSLFFSLVYGLLIEGFFQGLKVAKGNEVKAKRLFASLTLATGITGVLSMFLTTAMGLLPMVATMYIGVLFIGILNGVAASYLTLLIWNRRLFAIFGKDPEISKN
jgi:hypothetical protein